MVKRYPVLMMVWLGAVLSLGAALYLAYEGSGGVSWVEVTGKLTDFVRPVEAEGAAGKKVYRVAYSYEAGGTWYHGTAFTNQVISLKPGMPYNVLYNKDMPAVSRLKPPMPWEWITIWLGIALMFVILGLWWWRQPER